MEKNQVTKKNMEWKGRPKIKWEDGVKQHLKVTKICHWKKQSKI